MRYRVMLFVFLALILVAGVCEKPPERQWERGFFEPIGGKSFDFVQGLEKKSIIGYDDEIPASFLPLKLVVLNTTAKRINDRMPAGLVFNPRNHEYQYMMLLQEFSFTVPADQDTTIFLPTYCCNEDLDEPDEEAIFDMDIQVWERELNELFDLVQGKRLEGDTAVELAQEALFEITDYNGLTDSTRQKLEDLP